MKKLLLCLVFWDMRAIIGMEWIKNTFSLVSGQSTTTKIEQSSNTENSQIRPVQRKPSSQTLYLEHLRKFIILMDQHELYKYAANIGLLFHINDMRIHLLCQREKKYCFFVEQSSKSNTVGHNCAYILHKNKDELIGDATKSMIGSDPIIINNFSVFLDRIGFNNKIEEIEHDNLGIEEKQELLLNLFQERDQLIKVMMANKIS